MLQPLGLSHPMAGARCLWSVCHNGIVVVDDTANGGPDVAAMATRPDGGVDGGSSNNRENNNHNADGNRRHHRRSRPHLAVTAVTMMTIASERGGEATARRLQSNDEVTERQLSMAPARARLIEFVVQVQG